MRVNVIPSPNQACQQINTRTMDKIFCKLDWWLSARHWWTGQRRQHNILHQTQRYAGGPKTSYSLIVVDYCPQKEDPYRTCLTEGVNLIIYPGNIGTPTEDMLTSKFLLKIILSVPYTKFMGIDIQKFYLSTPMVRYYYMRLKIYIIPQDIID